MQAQLQERGIDLPSKTTPENASSQEDQEDQNEPSDEDYDSSDSENLSPIEGNGLLE